MSLSLQDAVDAYEKDLIQDALKTTRGNRAKAARLLNTTERIMNYKVKQLASTAAGSRSNKTAPAFHPSHNFVCPCPSADVPGFLRDAGLCGDAIAENGNQTGMSLGTGPSDEDVGLKRTCAAAVHRHTSSFLLEKPAKTPNGRMLVVLAFPLHYCAPTGSRWRRYSIPNSSIA